MARGQHLRVSRPAGHHHDGIDLGNGRIIHFASEPGEGKVAARIRVDDFEFFARGGTVSVRSYAVAIDADQIVARAESRLGEGDYHLFFNNCEHFARWCVTGKHESEQVELAMSTGGVVGTGVVAATVGMDIVASAGLVTGLSGPGIMSGLASTGAFVGGGAVAGLVTLGAVPGAAGVVIVNRALRDDENLPKPERDARSAGRVASVAGAGIGSVGGVLALSSGGVVAGLSGAGISSGLAAIGAGVGGGMATGAIVLIAAPALGAAVLGYGVFRFLKSLGTATSGVQTID